MTEFGPAHLINRELSWLEFNQRVLDEARDPTNPLLERLKFFCITSSNIDEFFEVRVAGIKQQIAGGVNERSVDGLTPKETLRAITRRVRRMMEQLYRCWREELAPALAERKIRFLQMDQLTPGDMKRLEQYYYAEVRPVLTPLSIDPAHPFPQLLNKSLNIIVQLELKRNGHKQHHLAVVQVPRILPRLIRLGRGGMHQDYVFLDDLAGAYLRDLFPGTEILGFWPFRVTRNSELYIEEEEVANLLKAVENELHNRLRGDAVRLEIGADCPLPIREVLLANLRLEEEDLYITDGPLNPTGLMMVYDENNIPELRDHPFVAPAGPAFRGQPDLFAVIRQRDVLLHHPYENFSSVVRFLEQAAEDPNVLAIKQTLYRTGGDPRITGALMSAANNGKQVTAVVELRARFDEANNIQWARRLEEAGVHVVYGLVGLKIHAKIALVVRRDEDGIRRYMHLGTGNYNPTTARIYTDLSLFTCRAEFGEDATNLFNLLTGICQFQPTRKFLVAPFELHARMLQLIERETENARKGLPARILAKMNALVDPDIIEALYRASEAGVKIELMVRGICCLRPQIKGISTNIHVRSVVDRFLEHSRIYYFENACQPEAFIGSADWMPRNFFRRIELIVPVEDGILRDRIASEILPVFFADNTKARVLFPDATYRRPAPKKGAALRRCQTEFMASSTGTPSGKSILSGATKPAPIQVKLAPRPTQTGSGKVKPSKS